MNPCPLLDLGQQPLFLGLTLFGNVQQKSLSKIFFARSQVSLTKKTDERSTFGELIIIIIIIIIIITT